MLRQLRASIICVLVITVFAGFVFPGIVTVLAKLAFRHQANGSLIEKDGKVIGSDLIGQNFADPKYLHPRPSAAGSGYDASLSGGTNLGPTSDKLINGIHKKLANGKDDPGNFDGIKDLAVAYRKDNGLSDSAQVPADAVTRSASGLDPDISPANADLQAARIAKARGISDAEVKKAIANGTFERQFGILGEPRVNVLKVNMELDKAAVVK